MINQIPYDFLRRLRSPVTWTDIKYAYENGIVDSKTIIDYACDIVRENDNQSEDIILVACARASDSLAPLLVRIVGDNVEIPSVVQKKWALILASFVAENKSSDPLSAVEDIYSSHDYPEELAQFVRYMPMVGPDLGNVEANELRMLDSLKEFSASIVSPLVETAGQ